MKLDLFIEASPVTSNINNESKESFNSQVHVDYYSCKAIIMIKHALSM